jgi:hypothetical protein
MKHAFDVLEVVLFFIVIYLGTPTTMILGWRRWWKAKPRTAMLPVLSLIGLLFGSASLLLAVSSVFYSTMIGGFPYYDPLLLKIYRWGFLLSLSGIIFALAGIWKPSPSRWFAPACSVGMLVFWFAMAMGE